MCIPPAPAPAPAPLPTQPRPALSRSGIVVGSCAAAVAAVAAAVWLRRRQRARQWEAAPEMQGCSAAAPAEAADGGLCAAAGGRHCQQQPQAKQQEQQEPGQCVGPVGAKRGPLQRPEDDSASQGLPSLGAVAAAATGPPSRQARPLSPAALLAPQASADANGSAAAAPSSQASEAAPGWPDPRRTSEGQLRLRGSLPYFPYHSSGGAAAGPAPAALATAGESMGPAQLDAESCSASFLAVSVDTPEGSNGGAEVRGRGGQWGAAPVGMEA